MDQRNRSRQSAESCEVVQKKKLFITEFTRGPCLSRFQEVSALTVPSPTFENCYIILNSSSWAADLQPQPQ